MRKEKTSILVHIIFILFAAACIVPMIIVISASLTSVEDLSHHGFSLFPPKVDFSAYAYLFENPKQIINGYKVTVFITLVGTFLGVLVTAMTAYPLARQNFKLKRGVTWFLYFPSLFSGGMVASYIINTQYLHLTDNIWVMIIPGVLNVYHTFMIRSFFQQLPDGLFDAAKVDGAGEWRIFFVIALRLSKPVLATTAFLGALGRWNTWYAAQLYIRSEEKYPLQYLLQRMMRNIQALLDAMDKVPSMFAATDIPGENLRMALLVVCIGPMMMFFPFFQKYFTKGMTVGAVKG